MSVCLSVIVKIKKTSVVQKNQRGSKKPAWLSVEHGALKIKINSGVQNNSEFVRTYAGVRTIQNKINYSYDVRIVPLGRPESGIIIIRTVEASTGSSYSYAEFFFEKFGIRTFF